MSSANSMSPFFSEKFKSLVPYTPGEQPKNREYVKLNTNESPFPPSPRAVKYAAEAVREANLYPDPDSTELVGRLSALLGINKECLTVTNGSDEILNFAFMAYCDTSHHAVFPDITYGFYKVFAKINNVPYEEIPLSDDFKINLGDYIAVNKTVFIANPNAPTGIALSPIDIEKIVVSNPDNVVIIDEAYVDFGAESCIPLTKKYKNLLVTGTFSKSRSLAGARLGFGVACPEIINDINTLRYSTNPYNINRMTMAAALGAIEDEDYTRKNLKSIIENRAFAKGELLSLGFTVTDSAANFLFARHPDVDGGTLYSELKRRGVLVRHFDGERISDYVRITVGTREQMEILIEKTKEILTLARLK